VDVGASAARIVGEVRANPAVRVFRLVVKKHPVKGPRLAGITGVLGRYSTHFNPSVVKRRNNIRLAAGAIDGTVVPPGGTFSLNRATGPRSKARGYRTAHVFMNGKLVDGLGGGVSQVTGTLFNAALVAGLPIAEYRTHQKPVKYVPVGRDATVWAGAFDMRFRNNTAAPIYISYVVQGDRLTATLYGAKRRGQTVRIGVRTRERGPGKLDAKLFRTVKRAGVVERKELVGRSHYRWKKPATGKRSLGQGPGTPP
jgi:vancomycin resistance protein YoaR